MAFEDEHTIAKCSDGVLVRDERGNLHVVDVELADVPPIRVTHHEIHPRPPIADKQREVVKGPK